MKEKKEEKKKDPEKRKESVEEILPTNIAEEGKGDNDENTLDVMNIVMNINVMSKTFVIIGILRQF